MVNNVKFLNDDLAVVARESGEVLVGRFGTTIMIICADCRQVDVDRPLIVFVEEVESEKAAQVLQLMLVVSMCKEDVNSEYFKRPCMMENMPDVDFTVHRKMDYLKWAEEALQIYQDKK